MSAAEGEVQEKGYTASFPSLINVSGKATYILVLKDDGGLVKLYALVNVENYSIVATGTTQQEAMKEYKRLLAQNGVTSPDKESDLPEEKFKVLDVNTASIGGETYIYITSPDKTLYKAQISADETLLLISKGDLISVKYSETSDSKIRYIDSWDFTQEPEDNSEVELYAEDDTADDTAKQDESAA